MTLWRPDDELADPATDLLADCHEIERCLLTLARFTGGRRHHARSVADCGAGHVETASERRQRRSLARQRLQNVRSGTCTDPDAHAAPYIGHPAALVDAGLYPVLAVIEDLYEPRPVAIAQALTLDRSTVIRHLQTLERRRLVYFDRGIARRRRPRVRLTVEGFGAMQAIRCARVERLDRIIRSWTEAERRTTTICLMRLARRLHGDVEPISLPPDLSERSRRTAHRLLPALALQDQPAGRGRRSWQ